MITAHVVYATITGNNEDIADIVTEALEDADVQVEETEISQTDPSVFENVDICVVCPYTYDEGALPEEGMDFYDDLSELDLKGKIFGVAGSVMSSTKNSTILQSTNSKKPLKKTGATKGSESIKINLEPDEKTSKKIGSLHI